MRQRNPFPYPVEVMETRAADGTVYGPAEVGPGDVIDWPVPLAGFVPADDPEPPAPDLAEGPGKDAGPKPRKQQPSGRQPAVTDEEPAP